MQMFEAKGVRLHYRIDGPTDGEPIVLAHCLGLDHRIWDAVIAGLPKSLRILRFDLRGHGLSDCPPAPYSMGQLVSDAEALMEGLNFRDATFVGLSIGGMIAQGLAAKRLDLVRSLVLINTAAKIGTRSLWQDRIEQVQNGGMPAIVDDTMNRWFTPAFRESANFPIWRNMLLNCPINGWTGCAAAIAGTDFYTPTAALRLSCLGLAASHDGSTPADMVRETIQLIPGAQFQLVKKAAHLSCIERPEEISATLRAYFRAQGIA